MTKIAKCCFFCVIVYCVQLFTANSQMISIRAELKGKNLGWIFYFFHIISSWKRFSNIYNVNTTIQWGTGNIVFIILTPTDTMNVFLMNIIHLPAFTFWNSWIPTNYLSILTTWYNLISWKFIKWYVNYFSCVTC